MSASLSFWPQPYWCGGLSVLQLGDNRQQPSRNGKRHMARHGEKRPPASAIYTDIFAYSFNHRRAVYPEVHLHIQLTPAPRKFGAVKRKKTGVVSLSERKAA